MTDTDVCPNCGEFAALEETTGWCQSCSRTTSTFCDGCGKKRYSNPCSSCKQQEWLATNADSIERYMVTGLSFAEACKRVKNEQSPICLSCGDSIKGATNAFFCKKKPECRRAKRIYRQKRDYHHLSVENALIQTIQQLTGEYERQQLLRAM